MQRAPRTGTKLAKGSASGPFILKSAVFMTEKGCQGDIVFRFSMLPGEWRVSSPLKARLVWVRYAGIKKTGSGKLAHELAMAVLETVSQPDSKDRLQAPAT